MENPAVESVPAPLVVILLLAVVASIAISLRVWSRPQQLSEMVPYRPRHPVPWTVYDLVLVLLLYVALLGVGMAVVEQILGPEAGTPPAIIDVENPSTPHVIARLLAAGGFARAMLCVVSAVVVAPIVEEFLFRVLLQGWLERVGVVLRRQTPTFRRRLPRGFGPIGLATVLFAALHFRVDAPAANLRYQQYLLVANTVANVLALVLAVGLLKIRCGASGEDFGWQPRAFWSDVRMGLWAFLATAAPIYLVQLAVTAALPAYISADPITLVLVAGLLGTLYFRTHRIVPSVSYHMALNATSMAMAWFLLHS